MVTKVKLTEAEIRRISVYLDMIGLSKDAAQIYLELIKCGPKNMSELADKLQNFPSANYRLAYELERRGLIYRLSGRPMRYAAHPLSHGLEAAKRDYDAKLQEVLSIINNARDNEVSRLELVIGRQALYGKYESLATEAKNSIDVFSIGIAFSKSLLSVQKSAIKRGVVIRHAVQRLKSDNYYVINQWKQIGVNIKHAPSQRGFHLMIFDQDLLLLSFSDPSNTDNRISILTDNQTAIRLFSGQFETIWAAAKELD